MLDDSISFADVRVLIGGRKCTFRNLDELTPSLNTS